MKIPFLLLAVGMLIVCILMIGAFQGGTYFERRYIKQAIKAGQKNGIGKTIRIPQLKVIISKDVVWEEK